MLFLLVMMVAASAYADPAITIIQKDTTMRPVLSPGPQGLVGVNWRGAWHVVNDAVTYDGVAGTIKADAFTVASNAKVDHLDADELDGLDSTAFVTTSDRLQYALSSITQGPASHQGVAYDGTHYFFSDSNNLKKRATVGGADLAENTNPIAQITAATGAVGLNHLGDLDVSGDYLFSVVERWANCSDNSDRYLVKFNKSDLTFLTAYPLSQTHEVSGISINEADDSYYVSDYCAPNVHKYRLSTNAYLTAISVPDITTTQGVANDGRWLYLSGVYKNLPSVLRVGLDGLNPTMLYTGMVKFYDRPSTVEGLYYHNGDIGWWDGDIVDPRGHSLYLLKGH